MADWKTSLERLQRACANPREQLDRYLEQGKQVVGCFCPIRPEELVHAAGLIPMGMWGGTNRAEAGQELSARLCLSYYAGQYGAGAERRLIRGSPQ